MLYYKDSGGKVHSLESDKFKHLLPSDCALITQAQAETIQSASGNNIAWTNYKEDARARLMKSDITVLRCYERAVPVPLDWAEYRSSLRAIISAESGDPTQPLPPMPAYPAGT